METTDIRTALRSTLVQKQELVRDYQTFAETINRDDIAELYRDFAEQEGYAAATIKQKLEAL